MGCKYHLEDNSCRLDFPGQSQCNEDECASYQMDVNRLCPSCNTRGAGWSGYSKLGGLDYTCWSCGHTWNEPIVRYDTPGICLRCGKEYDDPRPEIIIPGVNPEIATSEWCAECNKVSMAALYRNRSAYYEYGIRPPWQSEGIPDKPKEGEIKDAG